MKGLSIISILITLLIVAYLTMQNAKEQTAASDPQAAKNKVEEVEKQVNEAMQKNLEKLKSIQEQQQ